MDGYAFAGCALGTVPAGQTLALTIVGTALAGQPWDGTLQAGQAVRIMTGAVIPTGADTVVAQEQVTVTGTTVTLPANGLPPGPTSACAVKTWPRGTSPCPKASPWHAAALGLAASLGLATLPVVRRLRVAYFSTGDEILTLGDAPAQGRCLTAIAIRLQACCAIWA